MAEGQTLYIHGVVHEDHPGFVFLRSDDVVDALRRTVLDLRAQMDAIDEDKVLDRDECLRLAAMIGAVEAIEQQADSLDLVSMAFLCDFTPDVSEPSDG